MLVALAALVIWLPEGDRGEATPVSDPVSAPDCPGHWHATIEVYVGGERVPMAPTAASNRDATGFHMHGDDSILHTHPLAPTCIPLANALKSLEIEVNPDGLTIGALSGADRGAIEGTHVEGEQNSLQIFHRPFGGAWTTASLDILDGQLGNGDKILVTFGAADSDGIRTQQESVPDLPPEYQPHEE